MGPPRISVLSEKSVTLMAAKSKGKIDKNEQAKATGEKLHLIVLLGKTVVQPGFSVTARYQLNAV